MPSLSAAKAFNAKRGIVEAFARYTKGNAHIVIVGRNETAAESIIATFPKPSTETGWKHEFVACEASLMKNITVINFLVISSGYVSLRGRNETEEGIDHQLAVRYYGRWKMISDLLPSLRAANNAGEASKVLSVLDTDNGMPVDLTNLGLKLKYSGVTAVRSSLTYTDMAFEEFALRDPEIAFTHISPGFVNTPIYNSKHWGMRLVAPIFKPMYMLFALFSGEKGFMRRNDKGEDIGMKKYFGTEEGRKTLWAHTVKEIDVDTGAHRPYHYYYTATFPTSPISHDLQNISKSRPHRDRVA
ncbi:NAD-P-binding protein [Mycena leptocephala]|nr:NAD-P-binding protein [Mycena leptocephala]